MLYGLKVDESHPCFFMHDLLDKLLYYYVSEKVFSDEVFPSIFTADYINGHGRKFKESLERLVLRLPKARAKRRRLYSQFVNNNAIRILCSDKTVCPEQSINWSRGYAKELKSFMIDLYQSKLDLSPFRKNGDGNKPLHGFYKDFIDLNGVVCPFCGLNNYKNKFGRRREDLDHYLFKGHYPFAAANMWNLIPTCVDCNQGYKKDLDVLFDGSARKQAYYPYECVAGIKLVVDLDVTMSNKEPAAWSVKIFSKSPLENEKMENWNRVYGIEERYRNELAALHDSWILSDLKERANQFVDQSDFKKFMLSRARLHQKLFSEKLEPKSFVKVSFFVFMARRADAAFIGKYLYPFNNGF